MRALASIIGCAWGVLAALSGCVEPPQRAETFGVRVVPDGSAWIVRWLGPGPVVIDGVPRVTWPVRLRDDVPHVVAGRVIPPRIADLAAPVRFVVLGDGRASTDGVGPSAYWPGLLNEALARVPAFIVNTGDLVKNGNDRAEWDRYLESLPIWPPMISVRGNHDRGPHFAALGAGVESGFDWRYGPVRVVGIDSDIAGSMAQVRLLDRLLAHDRAPWTVVVLHRPIYSRGTHGTDERGVNDDLIPVLEEHGVDLVFSGHDHDYERFCPMLGGECAAGGVTYVVTGGAATFTVPFPGLSHKVPAEQKRRDALHSRHFSGAHHVVEVSIEGDTATITAHATRTGNLRRGGVIDRFEVRRRGVSR